MTEVAKVTELVAAADECLSETGLGETAGSSIAGVVEAKAMRVLETVWREVLEDDTVAGKAFNLAKAAYSTGLDDAVHVRAMAEVALWLFGGRHSA